MFWRQQNGKSLHNLCFCFYLIYFKPNEAIQYSPVTVFKHGIDLSFIPPKASCWISEINFLSALSISYVLSDPDSFFVLQFCLNLENQPHYMTNCFFILWKIVRTPSAFRSLAYHTLSFCYFIWYLKHTLCNPVIILIDIV